MGCGVVAKKRADITETAKLVFQYETGITGTCRVMFVDKTGEREKEGGRGRKRERERERERERDPIPPFFMPGCSCKDR